MKVLLIGEKNSTNLGDQAIHKGLKEYLISQKLNVSSLDLSCGSEISQNGETRISQSHTQFMQFIKNNKFVYLPLNVFRRVLKHLHSFRYWVKMFNQNDFVIVGGGSLLIHNSFSFPISLLFVKLCAWYTKKEYYVLGCSMSNSHTYLSKRMLYHFLVSAKKIYLRDSLSVKYLHSNIGLDGIVSSDLALLLNDEDVGYGTQQKIIAINIIGYSNHKILEDEIFQKQYESMVIELITSFYDRGYIVQLFTTGSSVDYENALRLIRKINIKIDIFHPQTLKSLMCYFHTCDGVVSTRLHSAILSLVSSVPFVSITWDQKINGFLDEIGQIEACFTVNSDVNDVVKRLLLEINHGTLYLEKIKSKQIKLLKLHVNEIIQKSMMTHG